jgi:methionyl-tRNA synthetase
MKDFETLLITSALPYSRSPLTLKGLQSIYLPADIYARFHRRFGNRVLFICGTDDHGVPITVSADRENITPEEIIHHYHERLAEDFRKIHITFDHFSRTHSPDHFKVAQEFFQRLYTYGHLNIQDTLQLFCNNCMMFLPDWLVMGQCPHEFCGYLMAHGDGCDQCGRDVEPRELIHPRCAKCHEPAITRNSQHFYFKLTDFEDQLLNWLRSCEHWDSRIHEQLKEWWKTSFRDSSITRDLHWGIPVPIEEKGFEDKVIYVWFEALLGYLSAAMEWAKIQGTPEAWKEFWLSSECRLVHFINQKQVPFHSVLWPAVLIAQGEENSWNLPYNIVVHQPLQLLSEKLSQITETHSVSISKLLDNPVLTPDILRYTLATRLSKTKSQGITFRKFLEEREKLAEGFGNFTHRTLKFLLHHFQGRIPPLGERTPQDQQRLEEMNRYLNQMDQAYKKIQFPVVTQVFEQWANACNRFFEEEHPFLEMKHNRKRAETILHLAVSMLQSLSIAISPILVESTEKLWSFFQQPLPLWREVQPHCLFPETLFKEVTPLFPKLNFHNPLRKEELLLDFELRYLLEEDHEVYTKEFPVTSDSDPLPFHFIVGKILEQEVLASGGKIRCKVDLGFYEKWLYVTLEEKTPHLLNQFVLVALQSDPQEWNVGEVYGKILVCKEDGFPLILDSRYGLKPGSFLK